MTGLREPPKKEQSGRIVIRFLILLVLLVGVALLIWGATTNTLIEAEEDVSLDGLELVTRSGYAGGMVNVIEEPGGPIPVVLINGYDIAGSVVWDDVVASMGEDYRAVRIDLPGFGFSDRIPESGPGHTVASMAEVVATIVDDRAAVPVVLVGVGLGGEVSAEIAVTRPDLVQGLVLIDVDFWEGRGWLDIAKRLPFIGPAVTYTYHGGGRFGGSEWAPWCGEGGWCPRAGQSSSRDLAASIRSTTESLRAFLQTNPASLVPSDLGLIKTATVYLWSSRGDIPVDSVERVTETMGDVVSLVEVDGWQAHLDSPSSVASAIDRVAN